VKPRDLLDRARCYVDASNAHDVERIAALLAADASYHSTGVGIHEGADAIVAMNRAFFADNPDVHWDTSNYRLIAENAVEFDFVISLKGKRGRGVERIYFDTNSRISRVEVER
jgi:hypothetical protein